MTTPRFNTAFSRQIALWVLRAFSQKLARNEFFRKGRYIDDDLAGFLDAHSNILRVIHKDPARYFSIVLGLPRRDVSRALAPDSKLRSCGIVSPQFCSGSLPSDRNRRPFRNRPPEDDEFLFFNRSLARKMRCSPRTHPNSHSK